MICLKLDLNFCKIPNRQQFQNDPVTHNTSCCMYNLYLVLELKNVRIAISYSLAVPRLPALFLAASTRGIFRPGNGDFEGTGADRSSILGLQDLALHGAPRCARRVQFRSTWLGTRLGVIVFVGAGASVELMRHRRARVPIPTDHLVSALEGPLPHEVGGHVVQRLGVRRHLEGTDKVDELGALRIHCFLSAGAALVQSSAREEAAPDRAGLPGHLRRQALGRFGTQPQAQLQLEVGLSGSERIGGERFD